MKKIQTKQPMKRTCSPRNRRLVGGATRKRPSSPHTPDHVPAQPAFPPLFDSIPMPPDDEYLNEYMEGLIALPGPELDGVLFGPENDVRYFESRWIVGRSHTDDQIMRLLALLRRIQRPFERAQNPHQWMWEVALVSFFTYWLGTNTLGTIPWKKQGCDVLEVISLVWKTITWRHDHHGEMLHVFVVSGGVNVFERFLLETYRFVLPLYLLFEMKYNPVIAKTLEVERSIKAHHVDMHRTLMNARLSGCPQLRAAYEKHLEVARDTDIHYDPDVAIVADVDQTSFPEINFMTREDWDRDHPISDEELARRSEIPYEVYRTSIPTAAELDPLRRRR